MIQGVMEAAAGQFAGRAVRTRFLAKPGEWCAFFDLYPDGRRTFAFATNEAASGFRQAVMSSVMGVALSGETVICQNHGVLAPGRFTDWVRRRLQPKQRPAAQANVNGG